jgi:hypothetical protein
MDTKPKKIATLEIDPLYLNMFLPVIGFENNQYGAYPSIFFAMNLY